MTKELITLVNCPYCGKEEQSKDALIGHLISGSCEPPRAEVDTLKETNEPDIEQRAEFPMPCSICQAEITSMQHAEDHLKDEHPDEYKRIWKETHGVEPDGFSEKEVEPVKEEEPKPSEKSEGYPSFEPPEEELEPEPVEPKTKASKSKRKKK